MYHAVGYLYILKSKCGSLAFYDKSSFYKNDHDFLYSTTERSGKYFADKEIYSRDLANHNYQLALTYLTTCITIINKILPKNSPQLITPTILFSYVTYVKVYHNPDVREIIKVLKIVIKKLTYLIRLIKNYFSHNHYELKQIYEILYHCYADLFSFSGNADDNLEKMKYKDLFEGFQVSDFVVQLHFDYANPPFQKISNPHFCYNHRHTVNREKYKNDKTECKFTQSDKHYKINDYACMLDNLTTYV